MCWTLLGGSASGTGHASGPLGLGGVTRALNGHDAPMNGDDNTPPTDPDDVAANLDPASLKGAHGRTGRMFKAAGLPFEDDEFDEADGDSTSSSSEHSDSGDSAGA